MKILSVSFLMFILTIGLTASLISQERRLKKSEVPPVILSTLEKNYPNAKVAGYSSEVGNEGAISYEIETVEGKIHRDLLFSADGTILEIEEAIKLSDLPKQVGSTLKKAYPKGSLLSAEKIIKGKTTEYEVVVKIGKKKTEVRLDAQGALLNKE